MVDVAKLIQTGQLYKAAGLTVKVDDLEKFTYLSDQIKYTRIGLAGKDKVTREQLAAVLNSDPEVRVIVKGLPVNEWVITMFETVPRSTETEVFDPEVLEKLMPYILDSIKLIRSSAKPDEHIN